MTIQRLASLAALASLLAITGCNLEERIAWSPDGSQAAVLADGTLRLCTTNGALATEGLSQVKAFSWLPDGRGLLYVREIACSNWTEVVPLLEPAEKNWISSAAKMVPELVTMASRGDQKYAERSLPKDFPVELAVLCARDTDPARLHAAQGTNDWEEIKTLTAPVRELGLIPVAANKFGQPRILRRSALALGQPRLSPRLPIVAYLCDDQLTLTPLAGGSNLVWSAKAHVANFDWMPDGKALVIARVERIEESNVNFGMLIRTELNTLNGIPHSLTNEQMLALTFFGARQAVRALPDGRILFAGAAMTLPAADQHRAHTQLFTLDPTLQEKAAPVAVPCAPDALPMDASYFVPSPDGQRVALAEPGSDAVAIVTLASGAVELVSPNRSGKNRTLPAWRGTNELYFAALPQTNAARPEMMRWQNGTVNVFSATWSDGVVTNLVEKPAPQQ